MTDMTELLDKALEYDKMCSEEFPDEKIFSNIYYTSLSYSLRIMKSLDENNDEKINEKKDMNEWIRVSEGEPETKEDVIKPEDICVINFDTMIKVMDVDKNNLCTVDALLLSGDNGENVIIEFKNTSLKKIYGKYINATHKDFIMPKLKGSKNILKDYVETSNLHFIFVYNKNDIPAKIPPKKAERIEGVCTDSRGKQSRVSKVKFNEHSQKKSDALQNFERVFSKLGFSDCESTKFLQSTRCGRKMVKNKNKFSLITQYEFSEFYEIFKNWNWGRYSKYFNC